MNDHTIQTGREKLRILAFEVTRRCRYSCKHCRAGVDSGVDTDELTAGQCKSILKSVADFDKCVVVLTGGEPTERRDICELIGFGTGLGLKMCLATCGYNMDGGSIHRLKQSGILTLSFSLDGARPQTHDSFRRADGAFGVVLNAAKLARQEKMRFQINTTVTRDNIKEVPEIAHLAERIGAYCFNPFILVPTGRGRELSDQILDSNQYEGLLKDLLKLRGELGIQMRITCGPQFARIIRQASQNPSKSKQIVNRQSSIENPSGCMGGSGFGFISCRGDVQTCGFLDISAGNLVENGFDFGRIWRDSDFLKKVRDFSAYKGKCGSCEFVRVCGGCRARAYAMMGDYLAADPICGYRQGADQRLKCKNKDAF